jgi:O-antigen ligase
MGLTKVHTSTNLKVQTPVEPPSLPAWTQILLATIGAVFETIERGSSIGLCLAYIVILIAGKAHPKAQLIANYGLLLTLPIAMISQRNPLAVMTLLTSYGFWRLGQCHPNNGILKQKNTILAILPLIMLMAWELTVEIIQAINNNPYYSFQWSINLAGSLGLGLVLANVMRELKRHWEITIPLVIIAAYSLASHQTAAEHTWPTPIFNHKNTIAVTMVISLSIMLYEYITTKNHKILPWLIIVLIILTINPSRLGIFSALLLAALAIISYKSEPPNNKKTKKQRKIKILMFLLVLAVPLGIFGITEWDRKSNYEENIRPEQITRKYDPTTGRSIMWKIAINEWVKKPWGSGAKHWEIHGMPQMIKYNGFEAKNPHNGFLEMLLSYGIIGIALLVMCLLLPILKLNASVPNKAILLTGATIPLFVESFSWTYGGGPLLSIWLACCIVNQTKNEDVTN